MPQLNQQFPASRGSSGGGIVESYPKAAGKRAPAPDAQTAEAVAVGRAAARSTQLQNRLNFFRSAASLMALNGAVKDRL